MGKWCDLPLELVELIEDNLILYADKIRIRAVCEYWNARLPKINREFPWLLQAVNDNVEASHALFNPIDKKFYGLDLRNVLQGKICKGSSYGWVVTVEDKLYNTKKYKMNSNRIYLVNPLTSARIQLPPRNKFPDIMKYNPYKVDKEYSVFSTEGDCSSFFPSSAQSMNDMLTDKFVMSSDPSRSDDKDCVIATIYGPYSQLACCTLKNRRWNPLPFIEKNGIKNGTCEDIIFHKGKLHALEGCGGVNQVLVFENINGVKPNPLIKLVARYAIDVKDLIPCLPSSNWYIITENYLVEHSDRSGLMIVERYIRVTKTDIEDVEMSKTLYFNVLKVDPINRCTVELKSIGEDVVILGMNAAISISSGNSVGYKANQIYFTDCNTSYDRRHSKLEDSEIGVFNLEDRSIQPLYGLKSGPKFLWPPPIWFS